jgi:hypothetical protein
MQTSNHCHIVLGKKFNPPAMQSSKMHQTLKLLKSETFTKKTIFFFKLTKRVLWLQVLLADKELLAGTISIIKCLINIQHVLRLTADFAKCFVFNSVNNNNNFIQLSFLRISLATFLLKERTCSYEATLVVGY